MTSKISFKMNKSLNNGLDFAVAKSKYTYPRKIIFSIMGGMFIAFGYMAYHIIHAQSIANGGSESVLALLGAAAIFPTGILMCLFLGGNLFTSNALVFMASAKKKISWWLFAEDLLITWIFNFIGSMLMVLIGWGAIYLGAPMHATAGGNVSDYYGMSARQYEAFKLANGKIDLGWWQTILSGILCNLIVAGSVFMFTIVDNKLIGTIVVWFMIALFVIGGFQHIVANMYAEPLGVIIGIQHHVPAGAFKGWEGQAEVGKMFYNSLLPTTVGNLIGGISIPAVYLLAETKIAGGKTGTTVITTSDVNTEDKECCLTENK